MRTNYTFNSSSFFFRAFPMIWNVASARDFTTQMVCMVVLRICPPSGALVAKNACYKPGVGKLVQQKSHLQKPKTPASRKTSLKCQYKNSY